MNTKKIAITFTTDALREKAALLAEQLQLPLVDITTSTYDFLLVYQDDFLEIRPLHDATLGPFHIDFTKGKSGFRRSHTFIKNELLAKAVGVKGHQTLHVMDATAGLGRDSFVLACLGCKVTLLERSPIVSALLKDGLTRWLAQEKNPEKLSLTLIQTDAIDYLTTLKTLDFPDVIYLDPMYPHRTQSALVKKEMRIIRTFVGKDDDADSLLRMALQRAIKRVVVKRPRLAPTLSALKPTIVFSGKQHRFDVYLMPFLGG